MGGGYGRRGEEDRSRDDGDFRGAEDEAEGQEEEEIGETEIVWLSIPQHPRR